jgi:glutamate/tyrosine decarboxylase-like PLP-dependent enzyme
MEDQFLLPNGANKEQLRQMGYAFVDLIIDRVLARQTEEFTTKTNFDHTIPKNGKALKEIIKTIEKDILPATINLHHPGYMGHMDSVPAAITIWADALTSAINNNMLSYELSPVFTELEVSLLSWFGQKFGLSSTCFGTLTAGGSLANITALLLARNHQDKMIIQQGNKRPLYAFVSEAAHTSFDKAMNVLGLGKEQLVKIPTNYRGEILIDPLQDAIKEVKQKDGIPFIIIAVAGTTITGAIDPIGLLAEIAQANDCWFHIDCAYGGGVIFSDRWSHLLKGTSLADSITFNPQKWLGIARTCAMLLVKDRQMLEEGFDQHLPYMNSHNLNFGNLTLQGTRRTDILKLWLALQSFGLSGIAKYIDRSMSFTQTFCQIIDRSTKAKLSLEPTLNIVCLESKDPNLTNKELQQQLQMNNQYWLSLPTWKGREILKAVILHPYPKLTDIL